MLDTPVEIDSRLVQRAIATADVLSIFFPWLGKALILDARHRRDTPPAVFADGMVNSAEERLRRISRRRPQLPAVERLTALPWPAATGSFLDSGAYDQLVRRLYQLGFGELESDCRRALAELQRAERRVKLSYVRGDHCRTVYERPRWH
jgi:hypothetical protein